MRDRDPMDPLQTKPAAWPALVALGGHAIGVALIAVLIAAWWMPGADVLAEVDAAVLVEAAAMSTAALAMHLALSAALWATLWQTSGRLRRAPARVPRLVRLARGTILTETIIVLPVALLLIFGLAQLSVINIAGMLANVATVQAARTVWVWHPEIEASRRGVTPSLVRDMARVQAAAVLAPAAPGDYVLRDATGTEAFQRMRAALVAAQLENVSNNAGQQAHGIALREAESYGDARGDLSFARSLDGTTFTQRTARKFTFAYMATDVDIMEEAERVGARLSYKQNCAFPIAARVFGDSDSVAGRDGLYAEIAREYTLPKQVKPNARLPKP